MPLETYSGAISVFDDIFVNVGNLQATLPLFLIFSIKLDMKIFVLESLRKFLSRISLIVFGLEN